MPEKRRHREPVRRPYFEAMFGGRPLFRCPVCGIARTDRKGLPGDRAIADHIVALHPTPPMPTADERARAAGLVIDGSTRKEPRP